MNNVNWWLMVLAFVLGLVLTLALTVRRVKREVPEYAGGRGAPAFGSGKAERAPGAATTATAPGAATAAAGAGAGAAGVVAASKFTGGRGDAETGDTDVDAEPYGEGSIRTAAATTGPSGYDIKGNEDSRLYHTTDSPSYEQTIAEIWFSDWESAERAGFQRWDRAEGVAKGAAAAAGGGAAVAGVAKFASSGGGDTGDRDEPYGAGSLRTAGTADAPSGYDIKGNEDSMLYHTTASPSYKRTIAEIWFRDEETAIAAGFNRWDSGKSQRGKR